MIFTLYMKYIFTKQPYKLRHAQNYFYSVTKIVEILFFSLTCERACNLQFTRCRLTYCKVPTCKCYPPNICRGQRVCKHSSFTFMHTVSCSPITLMDWGHSSSHLDRLLLFHACQFIMATAYQMHGMDYNKDATLRSTLI